MKAQAQQNADDRLTYWKPCCRQREGVWPRFIHTQPGTVMQRTCSRSAERRAVCVKYNKRATCIITLSFRGKNVVY